MSARKFNNTFFNASKLEAVNAVGGWSVTSSTQLFYNCTALRRIIGELSIITHANSAFQNCKSLEEVSLRIHSVSSSPSINLQWSPLINLASFRYMLNRKNGSLAATVTVHPDIYAKLTDPDNTEWNKILLDAQAKNITFASA